MRRIALAGTAALSLALAGCQNDAEDTPDITEAIPLDPETDEGIGDDESADGSDTISPDAPPISETPNSGGMESGSNPPGMTTPPPGSKLQPAD